MAVLMLRSIAWTVEAYAKSVSSFLGRAVKPCFFHYDPHQ